MRCAPGRLRAPSPESATPPPGKGTSRAGRAGSGAGNRPRVLGLLCASLGGPGDPSAGPRARQKEPAHQRTSKEPRRTEVAKASPCHSGHRPHLQLSAAKCRRSWRGGAGSALGPSGEDRGEAGRGLRGQEAASRSQHERAAEQCVTTTLLSRNISEVLVEGVCCLNFLFPCDLRDEKRSCLLGWFFQVVPGWKL